MPRSGPAWRSSAPAAEVIGRSAGINYRFATLQTAADDMMKFSTSSRTRPRVRSFRDASHLSPVFGDNGAGHAHMSCGRTANLFYDERGYSPVRPGPLVHRWPHGHAPRCLHRQIGDYAGARRRARSAPLLGAQPLRMHPYPRGRPRPESAWVPRAGPEREPSPGPLPPASWRVSTASSAASSRQLPSTKDATNTPGRVPGHC